MREKADMIWKQGFKDLLSSPQNCCEMHEIHLRCPNSDDSLLPALLPAANCVYVYATQVYIQVHPNPLRTGSFRLLIASFSHSGNGLLIMASAVAFAPGFQTPYQMAREMPLTSGCSKDGIRKREKEIRSKAVTHPSVAEHATRSAGHSFF